MRLSNRQLQGEDEIPLTKSQIKKIQKALLQKKGVGLKISRTQAMKGGSIFSSLAGLATKALPTVTKAASHILPGLAQGVASALTSLGIDKLFGGSIYLEPENLPYIKPYLNQFTPEQLTAIHDATQSGRGLQIDLSPEQETG